VRAVLCGLPRSLGRLPRSLGRCPSITTVSAWGAKPAADSPTFSENFAGPCGPRGSGGRLWPLFSGGSCGTCPLRWGSPRWGAAPTGQVPQAPLRLAPFWGVLRSLRLPRAPSWGGERSLPLSASLSANLRLETSLPDSQAGNYTPLGRGVKQARQKGPSRTPRARPNVRPRNQLPRCRFPPVFSGRPNY